MALPTYDGSRLNLQAVMQAVAHPAPFAGVRIDDQGCSLLANNFNAMWARALNERSNGITHFLMLHADVIPLSPNWVGEMHEIMQQVGASVLSVILPIKDHWGLTTTAMERNHVWAPRRLTMKEVYQQPPTFTHERLLVNTGLMMVDFRSSWVERAYFTINDAIGRKPSGEFYARAESEDWFFSRLARSLGATLFATREIAATHFGPACYDNASGWGDMETDPGGDRLIEPALPMRN
jgi:hypothetical protein